MQSKHAGVLSTSQHDQTSSVAIASAVTYDTNTILCLKAIFASAPLSSVSMATDTVTSVEVTPMFASHTHICRKNNYYYHNYLMGNHWMLVVDNQHHEMVVMC